MTTARPLSEDRTDRSPEAPPPPGRTWRTGVWLLLVAGAVGNSVASVASVPTAVHLGLSLLCGVCVVLLVAGHLRRR
ncbi:hypothetical protein [Modestobacter sp. NPDC049651]|uniref:hypothetical protein n=1 Tax=unclassified Modestobacter TaxID=2643866 RepID=UPI00340C9FE0